MLSTVVAAVTTLLTCIGLGYYVLALWSARLFHRQVRRPASGFQPGVTILKPVKGLDPGMYASFESHCRQDYSGPYEILFGVSTMDDPAVAAIKRLQLDYPERTIRLLVCSKILGANGKVSNLVQMSREASHNYLVINDSDIMVSPRYLQNVMGAFKPVNRPDARIGMVTTLYRGKAHRTLGSRMEALGIATDFIPGALTAYRLERGLRFALGATLAISRDALDAIGGLEPLVDYLADDYELGSRVSAKGFEVALSPEVVETYVPPYTFPQFLDHQTRWSRSTRDSRKFGYAGLLFTYGLPWALLNVVASGASLTSFALLSLVLLARVALALAVGVGVLNDVQVLRDLWLIVPRDVLALGLWAWSYAGDTVAWRGQRFMLKNGKLNRIAA